MIAYLATLDLSTLIRRSRVGCLMAVASLCCDAFATVQGAEPMSPSAALADFVLPLGYRVELVAAEPQVVDPVAIAFDHQGRLWVIEMRDYPTLAKGAKPSSRIRILRDNDGDGVFETADTFAADLPLPTGLQLWKSGAFVTLAGEVAYFPDDNHDGRADRQETWYRGFATENEQLRANHPTLAADGWIYVAGGLRGGRIESLRRPSDAPISINGRDFAFNPRSGECRPVSGGGQFGLTFDNFGRRFTCSNRNPLIEAMIEQRYLDLNPKFLLSQVVQDAAVAGADSRLYPRSRAITTSAQHSGQFTAACGVEIYRGNALSCDAGGNAFICEPTANLIHRERVDSIGSTTRATPVDQGTEFLTATDEWFRPVNLANGPDGALYVVDMYRAVIEHPEWMPPELRRRPDLLDGNDRGRIYRIVSETRGANKAAASVSIATTDPTDLSTLLNHENSWHRETAARRLLEVGGDAVIKPLEQIASNAPKPVARYLAISTLDALASLPPQLLVGTLSDATPEIRTLGLVLAEQHLCNSHELVRNVVMLADDPDPRVRYQTALTSMYLPSAQAFSALHAIALQDFADEWTCRVVALAVREQAQALLEKLLSESASIEFTSMLAQELVDAVISNDDGEQLAAVLGSIDRFSPSTSRMLLLAADDALRRRGSSLSNSLETVAKKSPRAHLSIEKLFDNALDQFCKESAEEADRIAAARLLQLDSRPALAQHLLELLKQNASPVIKAAAIASMRSQSSAEVANDLLALFPRQLPTVRRATLDLLTSRPDWTSQLLHAVAIEQIAASDVDPTRRQLLTQHANSALREEAERVFGSLSTNRQAVVQRYHASLDLTGDAQLGRAVFSSNCASCHRISNEGIAVGPDIGDASIKTSLQLLTDILDPNRAVEANFVNYVAITIDGIGHQGIIRSESESGIVLLGADGKSTSILRDDIESLTSGKSLMPEGFEQQIDPQMMAHLLAFLKTWRHAAELSEPK